MTQQIRGTTLRVWFWFILMGTLLGAVIAGGVAILVPSGYTARVTLLVAPAPTNGVITSNDLQIAQAYIPTMAELATIRPLLQRVISSTGVAVDPETLAENVSTHVPVGTSLLDISVSNRDAANAAALANGIAGELASLFPESGSATSGNPRLISTVVDPATAPTIRDGPGLPVRIALGGAIALFIAISIAFLVENAGRGAQSVGRGIERVGRRRDGGGPDEVGEPYPTGNSGRA